MSKEYTKQQANDKTPQGYKYCGYWDNFYHYTKYVKGKGYTTVSANAEDLSDGNLQSMVDMGLTRVF